MKSKRLRLTMNAGEEAEIPKDWYPSRLSEPINWEQMPAPLPITPIEPDEIIRDIIEATLVKVKNNAAAEVAEAAARCLNILNAKKV
ncbi:MAG: hypothetical protein ACTHMT_00745 [Verrucomicrobiota bacterium]